MVFGTSCKAGAFAVGVCKRYVRLGKAAKPAVAVAVIRVHVHHLLHACNLGLQNKVLPYT